MNCINDLLKNNSNAFYVFDAGEIKNRIQYLRKNLPNNINICYAVKANTFIIKEINEYVDRFEICSTGECEICEELDIENKKVVISGINKDNDFITNSIINKDNRIYTIESINQFNLIYNTAKDNNKKVKILLRLTNRSQFGINDYDIENIISNYKNDEYLQILGIQYFSGTQKDSIKKIERELNEVYDLLKKLENKYGYVAEEFEYGTGFPVSYFEGDTFNEDEFLSNFSKLIEKISHEYKTTLEIGRSLVASCGTYYTHVVDLKNNCEVNYAVVDGGMHHLEYYGQFMSMKIPYLTVYNEAEGNGMDNYSIVGSLCSMNDILVKNIKLKRLKLGSVICFKNVGAYSMTECISLFLSRDLPKIYIKKDNGEYVCVRDIINTVSFNMPKY